MKWPSYFLYFQIPIKIIYFGALIFLLNLFMIFLLIFLIPFALYLYRKLISLVAPVFSPKLGKILNLSSIFHTSRRNKKSPMATYVFSQMTIEGHVDLEEFKQDFQDKILDLVNSRGQLVYPELRQYFVEWMGHLFWQNCENFDMNEHFEIWDKCKIEPQDSPEGVRCKLSEILKEIMDIKFDEKRPLWNIYFVKNERENNTVLILKVHHAICDCFSLLKIVSKIFSNEKFLMNQEKVEDSHNSRQIFMKLVRTPYTTSKLIFGGLSNKTEWQRKIKTSDFRTKSSEVPIGISNTVPFSKIKQISQNNQVRVSSVILAGFCGGIRNFMLRKGLKIPENPIMGVTMARPNHPNNKLRNHVYGLGLALPLGDSSPSSRLQKTYSRYEAFRTRNYFMYFYSYFSILFNTLPHKLLVSASVLQKKYRPSDLQFGYSGVPGPKHDLSWRGQKAQIVGFVIPFYISGLGLLMTSISDAEGIRFTATGIKSAFQSDQSAQELLSLIEEEFNVLAKINNFQV